MINKKRECYLDFDYSKSVKIDKIIVLHIGVYKLSEFITALLGTVQKRRPQNKAILNPSLMFSCPFRAFALSPGHSEFILDFSRQFTDT